MSTLSKFVTKIRPASLEDGEQIAKLFMKVWHVSLKDMVPQGFLDQFNHEKQKQKYENRAIDPEWILLVAEYGGSIVGMIGVTKNSSEPVEYQKQIRAMYVDPDFQRKGIGTALFERMLSKIKELQVDAVMLWCIKANHFACSFYEKHGGKRIESVTPPQEYSAMPHIIYAWKF